MDTTSRQRRSHSNVVLNAAPVVHPHRVSEFWNRVDKKSPESCWNWKSSKNENGYGRFSANGCQHYAHRISYALAHGFIPPPLKLFVLHRCDNPACVNPDHLYLGTKSDNSADMMRRGRMRGGFRKERTA